MDRPPVVLAHVMRMFTTEQLIGASKIWEQHLSVGQYNRVHKKGKDFEEVTSRPTSATEALASCREVNVQALRAPIATRNKCHASSNRCLTTSNKKLLVTSSFLDYVVPSSEAVREEAGSGTQNQTWLRDPHRP